MKVFFLAILFAIASFGCGDNLDGIDGGGDPPEEFCGISTGGICKKDADCVTGGCSGQVCAAKSEPPMMTTCEWRDCYDDEKFGVACVCVSKECRWE